MTGEYVLSGTPEALWAELEGGGVEIEDEHLATIADIRAGCCDDALSPQRLAAVKRWRAAQARKSK